LIHLDDYHINDPTFDHTIILKIQKQENKYEEKNKFTKTEDILSNEFVQVLSTERYRIGS